MARRRLGVAFRPFWGWIAVLFAVPLLAIGPAWASTADFEAALQGLTRPSTEQVTHALETLEGTGDPRVLGVLEAFRDGNVSVSDTGRVFVRDSAGALHDAATGSPPGGESLHEPIVDNAVRRVLAPLAARLELRAPDPPLRLAPVA